VNPPLRTPEDQAALWSGFKDGVIQILASDHAPHTIDEKTQEFESAPAGIPGVETMLPIMLSFHKHHKITLERLVNAISEKPAKLFNLPKGRLATGYDGDLVVIDFYHERDIKIENLHSKCGWSPYENMPAIFPMFTVVRGKIIVKDGNLEADMGWGKFYN
jgi:dihydroorotase